MVALWVLPALAALVLALKLVVYILAKRQNNISRRYKVTLGGKKQRILVEGKNTSLPVLVVLHGGPGHPLPYGMCCRGALPRLTQNFITVYWDQYGCGANWAKLDHGFTLQGYNAMLGDLIAHLRAQFPESPLYLFGLSWGTMLCAGAAIELGEEIDGVVAYGQILSFKENNRLAIEALEACHMKEADRALLQRAKKESAATASEILDGLLAKYTHGVKYRGKDVKNGFDPLRLWPLLLSPDYGPLSYWRAKRGYKNVRDNTKIMPLLAGMDIRSALSGVQVPYHIVQGRHDVSTATPLVEDFVRRAGNEKITLRVYEKSSHTPGHGDMQDLLRDLPVLVKW